MAQTKILISLLPFAYDELLPRVGIEIDSDGFPVIDFDGQYYKVTLSIGNNGTVATVYNVGKGKVILTLQKYLVEDPATAGQKKGLPTVHYLLSLLRHELLPFQVIGTSPAEMVVSRQKNGWRISLLNNRGVYKQPLTAPVIVNSEKTEQTLVFPDEIVSATEQLTGKKLAVKKAKGKNTLTVTIPAGDLVIIDVVTKK